MEVVRVTDFIEIDGESYGSYGCPVCENNCVGDIDMPFCFECGQRLSWDDIKKNDTLSCE